MSRKSLDVLITCKYIIYFVFSSFISISSFSVNANNDNTRLKESPTEWALEKQTSKYKLFTRPHNNSPFLQIKSESVFNVELSKVKAHFTDKGCWRWNLRCRQSVVKVSDDKTIGEYLKVGVDMPWPIDDRDFVFKIEKKETLGAGSEFPKFELLLNPIDGIAKSKGYVRGRSQAHYYLETISSELVSDDDISNNDTSNNDNALKAVAQKYTKLTIIMHTEFGGSVSPSLINGKLLSEHESDIKALYDLVR